MAAAAAWSTSSKPPPSSSGALGGAAGPVVRISLVVSLLLVVAGVALLLVGGTTLNAVAATLLGTAGVIWVSLVFFAVGRSEDREREASRAAAEGRSAAKPTPEPGARDPHVAPPHDDQARQSPGGRRFRRRP